MKTLAALFLMFMAGSMLSVGGCASPAYSPVENIQRIARNWQYENLQMDDDWNHVMMLTPASRLTMWNVKTPE